MNFRKDIQGLRGVAVLLVLFYHLYPNIMSGGYIGVDIFFSISGFLVCYSIEDRIKKENKYFFLSFYSARLRRLLPSSLLVIVLLSIYISKYDIVYFSEFANDAISCLLIYANYNFFFKKVDYFHSNIKETPLLHYWSLSLEEQFYTYSPMLIYFFFNNILCLYLLISFSSISLCIYYGYKNINKGYFFISSRSWEFIFSALFKYSKKNIINKEYNCQCNYSSIIVILFLSLYYNDKTLYPSYNAFLPICASLLLIYSSSTNFF